MTIVVPGHASTGSRHCGGSPNRIEGIPSRGEGAPEDEEAAQQHSPAIDKSDNGSETRSRGKRDHSCSNDEFHGFSVQAERRP